MASSHKSVRHVKVLYQIFRVDPYNDDVHNKQQECLQILLFYEYMKKLANFKKANRDRKSDNISK